MVNPTETLYQALRLSLMRIRNTRLVVHTQNFRACLHGGGGPQVGEVTRLAVVKK